MLASSATSVEAAMEKAGGGAVSVDTKLDGIRIQVHRWDDEVVVATRSLEVITDRLPEVVEVARVAARPSGSCSTARCWRSTTPAGRGPFQETASRTAMALRRGAST